MSGIGATGAIFFDGPCPFLTCLDTGPHGHDTCHECGTVRFANMYCRNCVTRGNWPEDFRAVLLSHLARPDEAG